MAVTIATVGSKKPNGNHVVKFYRFRPSAIDSEAIKPLFVLHSKLSLFEIHIFFQVSKNKLNSILRNFLVWTLQ